METSTAQSIDVIKRQTEKPAMTVRCGFYVKRKKRHCKMLPAKGNKYCAEHLCFQDDFDDEKMPGKKRIKCPLDPNHTVFEERLEKHLMKCNSKKKTEQEFYSEHINSGIIGYEKSEAEKVPLNKVPHQEISNLIERINSCYAKSTLNIEECSGTHRVLKEELENEEYGASARKHLLQQASLINILEKSSSFKKNTAFVELGAGKGKLSHWLQRAVGEIDQVEYFLVDRQHHRNKFDCYHKGEDQGPVFKRLYVDIEHLNLGKVNDLHGKEIVGIGKHLCGGATDLALRCLLEQKSGGVSSDEKACKKQKLDTTQFDVKLILLALCCYHRCTWASYVGNEFFTNNGFTAFDFHRVTQLCSWAVCGFRDHHKDSTNGDQEEKECENNQERNDFKLSSEEKKEIGIKCKRLIDVGRLEYLKKHGYKSKLMYYVDSEVTLENVALLAEPISVVNNE
eukprot:Seg3626.1 transcript_id=Seg3626.1/GoldUCD/mRNA.D3Y31 product=tRNA:m protein_id=Seg3626.1/GoldUCD/D3Y31